MCIGKDIWGDRVECHVCSTRNHSFNTIKPYGNDILNNLGPIGKGKVRRIKLQNENEVSYRNVLTTDHLKNSDVWMDYSNKSIGFAFMNGVHTFVLVYSLFFDSIFFVGIDYTNIDLDNLIATLGTEELKPTALRVELHPSLPQQAKELARVDDILPQIIVSKKGKIKSIRSACGGPG